jgi:hypothetical protein
MSTYSFRKSSSLSDEVPRILTDYEDYLRDRNETPMSFAYNASCILRIIRRNESNISSFTFTDLLGTELSYHGHLIKLEMIKTMVEAQLEAYHDLLRQHFFFGQPIPSNFLPDFEIEKLVDDTQSHVMGYTFMEDPRNHFDIYKSKYGAWLLSDETRRRKYVYDNGTELVWKPKPTLELIKSYQDLDLEMSPGLVTSSGPSTRGTEFGRHLFRKMPGAPRNLGMVHHAVSLNVTSDKTSHQRLLDLFVPHLPTREWANAFLRHLAIYRPFIEYLVERIFKDEPQVKQRYTYYLFPGVSHCMTTHDLSDKLSQLTRRHLGVGFGIKIWRSLTTVILQSIADVEVNDSNRQYYFDTANMHSTRTANFKYGGNTGNMLGADSRVISGCVRVALAWHKRIGVGQTHPLQTSTAPLIAVGAAEGTGSNPLELALTQIKAFRDESIASIRASVTKAIAESSLIYFPRPPPPKTWLPIVSDIDVHPSRLVAFQDFMQNPVVHWSCPQQAMFVEYLIRGVDNVLGILGTGFGKTTTIMFVAKKFSEGKSTVVIMPLNALHEDFHHRAREYGLKASRWQISGKFDSNAHMITAAIEDLMNEKFLE